MGKLNISQHYALPAMQIDSILGSLKRSMATKLFKVIVLYLTVKLHVEYCAWFSGKRKKNTRNMLINLPESSSGPPGHQPYEKGLIRLGQIVVFH